MELNLSAAPGAETLIKDSSTAQFAVDVIDASMQTPIIVDFWAPWCGPCKTLGPAIERVVKNAGGAVKLVKIDIDQSPEIAQQMRIQSIPAVYAFHQGRPVDGFVGALPESQIKSFVDRVLAAAGGAAGENPIEAAHAQAAELAEAGDHAAAADIFRQLIDHDPTDVKALAGFATALIKIGQTDDAQAFIEQLPDEVTKSQEMVSVLAALELAAQGDQARNELAALQARADAEPDNLHALYDLAVAQSATGDNEPAIENLLTIFKKDRNWNEEAARLQLLKIFEALGFSDPLAQDGRRRMSSIMFS
ncbi:MAG: thioredoxin [Alphaproteobacteria bacterium]|nr:thioredoxin [Alphaproteobacteria bacterium]